MAKLNVEPDDDHAPPVESTPLLPSSTSGSNRVLLHGFRRKSVAKLSSRASGVNVVDLHLDGDLSTAHPAEGLAPLFPTGGIREYDGREYIPYREATLVKSVSTTRNISSILQ